MPEIFKKQRKALSKLTKRINEKLDVFIEKTHIKGILVLSTIFLSLLGLIAPGMLFTKHDQEIISKSSDYTYQFNRWGNEAYQKFIGIWDENYAGKFYGDNNEIEITPELAKIVIEYHAKLLGIFNILENQLDVVAYVGKDIKVLLEYKTITELSDAKRLKEVSEEYDDIVGEFVRKKNSINDFMLRLNHEFGIDVDDLPTDKSSEVYINKVKLIFELVDSEDLFLKRDYNQIQFFHEFHRKLNNVINEYDGLVKLHNSHANSDKKWVILIYVIMAFLIASNQLLDYRLRTRKKLIKKSLKKHREKKAAVN